MSPPLQLHSSPPLILRPGDIAYAVGHASQWDEFYNFIQPVAAAFPYGPLPPPLLTPLLHSFYFTTESTFPCRYMQAIGNHEANFPGSNSFFQTIDRRVHTPATPLCSCSRVAHDNTSLQCVSFQASLTRPSPVPANAVCRTLCASSAAVTPALSSKAASTLQACEFNSRTVRKKTQGSFVYFLRGITRLTWEMCI